MIALERIGHCHHVPHIIGGNLPFGIFAFAHRDAYFVVVIHRDKQIRLHISKCQTLESS